MTDSDLMFRRASELAAHGALRRDLRARAGRSARSSGSRSSTRQLNAFVEVDAERRARGGRRDRPGDERPFAGVPIAIKDNRPVEGLRLTFGCR